MRMIVISCGNIYFLLKYIYKYVCASHHMQLNSHKATQPDDCQINLNSPWCSYSNSNSNNSYTHSKTADCAVFYIYMIFSLQIFCSFEMSWWSQQMEHIIAMCIFIYISAACFFQFSSPLLSHQQYSPYRIVPQYLCCSFVFCGCFIFPYEMHCSFILVVKKLALIFSTVVSQTTLFSHEFLFLFSLSLLPVVLYLWYFLAKGSNLHNFNLAF